VIIAYNRRALQALPAPRSLQDVALLLREHPDLRGRITVFDPEGKGMLTWPLGGKARPIGQRGAATPDASDTSDRRRKAGCGTFGRTGAGWPGC
jgi:hypothetical protein